MLETSPHSLPTLCPEAVIELTTSVGTVLLGRGQNKFSPRLSGDYKLSTASAIKSSAAVQALPQGPGQRRFLACAWDFTGA